MCLLKRSHKPTPSTSSMPDTAPPPYAETASIAEKDQPPPNYAANTIPQSLNIYYTPTRSWSTTFRLGPHADQPLYTAVMKRPWASSSVTLHPGPDSSQSPLSKAETVSKRLSDSSIVLYAGDGTAGEEVHETMKANRHTWSGASYTFSLPSTSEKGAQLPERYEWRPSHGDEVKAVGMYSWGLKLVAVGHLAEGSGEEGREEVLAVLADNNKMANKVARIEFVGRGMEGMGEMWKTMALTSGLRVWQKRRYANEAAAVV